MFTSDFLISRNIYYFWFCICFIHNAAVRFARPQHREFTARRILSLESNYQWTLNILFRRTPTILGKQIEQHFFAFCYLHHFCCSTWEWHQTTKNKNIDFVCATNDHISQFRSDRVHCSRIEFISAFFNAFSCAVLDKVVILHKIIIFPLSLVSIWSAFIICRLIKL